MFQNIQHSTVNINDATNFFFIAWKAILTFLSQSTFINFENLRVKWGGDREGRVVEGMEGGVTNTNYISKIHIKIYYCRRFLHSASYSSGHREVANHPGVQRGQSAQVTLTLHSEDHT